LSHLTRNEGIFASSDIAVGIDVLEETILGPNSTGHSPLEKSELEFVQSMASHSCAFRLRGAASVSLVSNIIEKSRASLDAGVAAIIFLVYGCVAFSFYVLFTACTPLTTMPYVPTLGSAIYLLVVLPCVGMAIQMSDGDKNNMKRVPPKNVRTVGFNPNERRLFYIMSLAKALFPALLPQILHLIVFGEFVIQFDPEFVAINCPNATTWVDIVRCDGMRNYSGVAKTSAGTLVFSQFMLCVVAASSAFVHRFLSVNEHLPWERNICWLYSVFISFGIIVTYITLSTERGSAKALPWYFYVIAGTTPFICLVWVEVCKRPEAKQEDRAEKLRRLQFETRLGAWSPR
jgi:magnesium-transporting ATPase (P-type)